MITLASSYIVIPDTAEKLPKNFRIQEVEGCRFSGSAQFSPQNYGSMSPYFANKKVTVIDLRQETHFFVNESQVSLRDLRNQANLGKSLAQVLADERQRVYEVAAQKTFQIFDLFKGEYQSCDIKGVETEEDFLKKRNVRYIRYAVTDQAHPTPDIVEDFIKVVKATTPQDSVHIHCEMGWGRTTTFLFIADAIKNAKKESFATILERQKNGGADLAEITAGEEWKVPFRIARYAFVEKFYEYCREGMLKPWSEYVK